MTAKPSPVGTQVRIQRYRLEYPEGMPPRIKTGIDIFVKESDHIAVLNRVREILEAKAKEWHESASFVTDPHREFLNQRADELLALAATLGNQTADGETPGETK